MTWDVDWMFVEVGFQGQWTLSLNLSEARCSFLDQLFRDQGAGNPRDPRFVLLISRPLLEEW